MKKDTKEWYLRDENAQPALGWDEPRTSPCGKYQLMVTKHPTKPGCWEYSKGVITNTETGETIAVVGRNFHAFPFSWIPKHKNGHAYLICGEDYQGQTVIELDTGKRIDILSAGAGKGFGFCWASHTPSPDGTLLAVDGCYWGAPYEVVIYDFSKPLEPPWKELLREPDANEIFSWDTDNTCRMGRTFEAVNVPGHPLHGKREWDMSVDELEQVEALAKEKGVEEDDLYTEVRDEIVWCG